MNQRVLEARFRGDLQSGGRSFRLDAELAMSGGVLALYGPSGSGKSTVLRALAGLLRPSSGQISIGQRAVYDSDGRVWQPAHRRSSGYVPQQRSLLPFLDVWGNVVFGLERHKRRRGNPEVLKLLEELGIAGLAGARPQSLSGGEAQKVALARALAVSPGNWGVVADIGVLDFQQGRYQDAVTRLGAAVELREGRTEILRWLGRALAKTGKRHEGFYRLAMASEREGRSAQALDYYQRALEGLDDGNP